MARTTRTRRGAPSVRFLTDYEDQSVDADTLVIPEDLTTLSDQELADLSASANEAFAAIFQDGAVDYTADDLAAMAALTEGIEALSAQSTEREAAAAARREEAAALAARVAPQAEEGSADEEQPEDGAEENGPEEGEDGAEDGDGTEEPEAEEGDEEPEALAASGGRRPEVRLNLSGLRGRQTAPRTERSAADAAPTIRDVAFAASEGNGLAAGAPVDFTDMGGFINHRLRTFNPKQFENAAKAGRKLRQQFGVATIQKPHGDFMINDNMSQNQIEDVIKRATDETQTPKGSLVASGGWCAPSETIYDIYDCGEVADGLYNVPTVGISRGGIRFNRGLDFGELMRQTGFHYTEEQDLIGAYGTDDDGVGDGTAGTKPCFHIECIDFVEERLELDGLCLTAGLLQARGYPEVIADAIRKALIAHEIRMDSRTIAKVVSGSNAVSLPADQVGAIAPLLTAIELQAQHYRASGSLGDNTVLEGVFPQWVRGAVRSDLSRRLGVDLISVPNARIQQWFTDRQISPQFVANWQSVGTTAASGFTSWPTEVDFLLYKAGTWVKGTSDVITLDTIYDSTLLGTNDYTALFTEEGNLVARRGCDSRVVTVPICPTGDTGGGVAIDCDGSAGA
jgi:hypothetical protein